MAFKRKQNMNMADSYSTFSASSEGETNAVRCALVAESFRVPGADPGIELYVRNKRPADMNCLRPEKTLLYVHGASYPASTSFDLPLNGLSMMDCIACRGWDVYCVDMRGYGHSTRPAEMEQPPEANPPITSTAVAARDVAVVVEHIFRRRGIAKLNLMGWSWGTAIMGLYASQYPVNVHRLVLYAPRWLSSRPSILERPGALGAYRTITPEAARQRWLREVPAEKVADLIPPGWFEQWAAATWATDPAGAQQDPPTIRAPNGVIDDDRKYWVAGIPIYSAAEIRVPTLLVHGEWDVDLPSEQPRALFAALKNAPYKRFIEIGEATHTLFMEKNRMQFFGEVMHFLDEPDAKFA
jgi:pimeloyl-ACP methyl ester carboxylesterase